MYTQDELSLLLEELIAFPTETQWIEFKSNLRENDRIGKYISGLANSACFCGREHGYVVWGVDNDTHEVKGTSFDPDTQCEGNQLLRMWLATMLAPQIEFEFYPFDYQGSRVVILEIEAAYRCPVAFDKTPWIRFGSSLTELSKHPRIAAEIYRTTGHDWSGETILGASLLDLDESALRLARVKYAEKHKDDDFAAEIPGWDDVTFLNKAKLAIDGKLTRAAIILLGKSESAHYVSPAVTRITWHLKNDDESTRDYKHFGLPFLKAVDGVLAKIRNLTLRMMPDGTLFPEEVNQYDLWALREALHNSIAHQDYSAGKTIVVTEYPDYIRFSNAGLFVPGTVEKVLHDKGRPRDYRNRQLVEAMVELKMIDTLGSGIRRMFNKQVERFLPLPDYDFSNDDVVLTMPGKVIDERYCKLLIANTGLSLDDILLLDKVQKHQPISKQAAELLRKKKLVGGRYPNLYPAVGVARRSDSLADYLEAKAFDDEFYMQHVLEFICAKGSVTRAEIDSLLLKHMSSVLDEGQKKTKIGNLLSLRLRRRLGWIDNIGSRTNSRWILTDQGRAQCRRCNLKCKKRCKKRNV